MTHRYAGLGALDGAEPYDVCVIGCGIAGALLGTELARAGVRTLILESGRELTSWLLDPRIRRLAECEVSGNAGYPARRTKPRLLGGNSSFWAGRCERLHPTDFDRSPYLPSCDPWPLSYASVEPYYERAEVMLRVRGAEASQFMPPRSSALPLPATGELSSLRRLFEAIGVTVDGAPTATPSRGFYFRVQDEILPAFFTSRSGMLVVGATVTRLLASADRHVIAAEVRTLDGSSRTARARMFVVASGAIETPRLLLLSGQDAFPHGIGNDYDRVGRGFNEHPSTEFHGRIEHSLGMPRRREVGRIYQFYDIVRNEGLGAIRIAVVWSRLLLHQRLPPRKMLLEAARSLGYKRATTLYLGPHIEMRPLDTNRVTLSKTRRDRFGDPIAHLHLSLGEDDRRTFDTARKIAADLFKQLGADDVREGTITFSRHHLGTCRMGVEPRKSVIDPDLRVHGTPNVYVLGSAAFVTGGAVPPTLTIAALACRLADHLVHMIRHAPPAIAERKFG